MTGLKRRDLLLLGGAVAAGWGVSIALRHTVPAGRDVSGNPVAREILAAGGAPGRDPPGADLTMAVFTDYQCPICRVSEPELDLAAAADGKVRVVYREWPVFGPVSERAAQVALAGARQGIYPALHRALMEEPRTLGETVLRETVARVGGDWARLEADLAADRAPIAAALAQNGRDALALGLPGTPGYLVGSILVIGAQTESGFHKAFAEARRAR